MSVAPDTSTLKIEAPGNPDAAARSRVYALLGEALAYPQGSVALRLLDGDLLADLSDALAATPHAISAPDELNTPISKHAIGEVQVIYTALFDVTGGTPQVSLLERRYGEVPEQKLWEALFSFYGHFGLDFSQGYAAEQPDHLLTQLPFMHYLSFLQSGTALDKMALCRGQRDFLKLHLAQWGGTMAEKLSLQENAEPYASLGLLMAQFVACDLEYLDASLVDAGPL